MKQSQSSDINAAMGRTIVDRHPPYCDVCVCPAVWSEHYGWRHKNDRWPFGIPSREDDSGHEVSTEQWATEEDQRGNESSRAALGL